VTEDRYEMILNHNRTLGKGLTLQVGIGGEYSKLAQSAPTAYREFWRPRGRRRWRGRPSQVSTCRSSSPA
jgi:hypothetical protein